MREFSLPALYEVPADGNLTDIVRRNAAQHPDVAVIARKTDGVWQDVTAAAFLAEVQAAAKGLIASQTELMGRAFNEALPRALRQEWAFYQALGESQGVIGRNTYRAIEGGLSAWIFLTLPLRPGWGVRNVIDNTAKVLTRGAHDPRVYWGEAIGAKGTSVFDLDLNAIGYKATPQLLSTSVQYPFVQNSSNSGKWNVGWSAWYQDYPAQSDFLNVLLGCGTIHPNSDASPNIAAFCDKSIQSKIDQAESMAATDPAGAATLWTQIDHAETDAAPWVDMYNPKQIDFLSSNVHGYLWNPQWYILIDRLWLS